MGPHVLDYFKHVSPKSLKAMGLALINRTGDAETLLLYSICVNSAAFKFINTVMSESDMGGIEEGMCEQAAKYLKSVKLAMTRIHLLAAPSLLFLQALLCSVSVQWWSCRLELTVCRRSLLKVRATLCIVGRSSPLRAKRAKISTSNRK
jgi:hypothetical protein